MNTAWYDICKKENTRRTNVAILTGFDMRLTIDMRMNRNYRSLSSSLINVLFLTMPPVFFIYREIQPWIIEDEFLPKKAKSTRAILARWMKRAILPALIFQLATILRQFYFCKEIMFWYHFLNATTELFEVVAIFKTHYAFLIYIF